MKNAVTTLLLGVLVTVASVAPASAQQVFDLDLRWYRFADPGGADPDAPNEVGPDDGFETDRGIVNGESAEFSPDGQLIITSSKADGRLDDYPTEHLTGGSAHLRLWTLDGTLLWDRKRSRGPDQNGDGRPDDQVADGEDEIEIATFSRDGTYVVAGGEDDQLEVWRIKDLTTGRLLEDPVLVRTLTEPGAGIDSERFSHSGELLLAGTEERGGIEIWRTTGDPSTWAHVGEAVHGDNMGQAVNHLDFSSDDQYLVTAGTNEEGRFWRIHVTRDEATGEISRVELEPLAVMPHPIRSAKSARFENVTDRHVIIGSKDQRQFVYDVEKLKTGDATPVQVLHNSLYAGWDQMTGVEIEPAAYSQNGRFLVNGGGPEHNFPPNNADYESSFFRVYETAEIQPGAPEPDPIFVQPAFHTEYFHFRDDDALLATVHEDGTLRLWEVTTGAARTIASEAFNELTGTHDRWTLSGSLATPADNEWGVTAEPAEPEIGEPSVVTQDVAWVGHRGARYLGADNLRGETHALTLTEAWDVSGFTGVEVQFAAAAAEGVFESGDVLRLLADTDGDDTFETVVAAFEPDADGNLALDGGDAVLGYMFTDVYVDLAPLLPENFGGTIRFRIEASTDSGDEELAFDSLRLTGTPSSASGTGSYDGEEVGGAPTLVLHANYPNPFRQGTTLSFDLPQPAHVQVDVVDVLGRRVLSLPPTRLAAGPRRTLPVDASALASGVYLYHTYATMPAGTATAAGRMSLIK